MDNLERREILEKISYFLNEENPSTTEARVRGKLHQIATVNQEFILTARKDKEFKEILNNCDLNTADSMGIGFAFWRLGEKLKYRIAGIDLMWEILRIANDKKMKVFLAANSNGLSTWEETKEAINKIFPELQIEGVNLNKENPNCQLPITNYQIVFCNFGAPYQEKFLNSQKSDKIKLALGVGGSFDFITEKLKRAPLWMRKFGLEWLFRLIQQPKRIKRICRAVIIFPLKLIIIKK